MAVFDSPHTHRHLSIGIVTVVCTLLSTRDNVNSPIAPIVKGQI